MLKVSSLIFDLLLLILSKSSYCSFGEENGWRCKEKFADYVWVLDPIDGTKSFITGMFLSVSTVEALNILLK